MKTDSTFCAILGHKIIGFHLAWSVLYSSFHKFNVSKIAAQLFISHHGDSTITNPSGPVYALPPQ